MLRPYQHKAIDEVYAWMSANDGNACIVMPTGSGKSHVIAALCKDAIQSWPETRILMLTHVRELIQQNAEKIYQHWPDAPLGIYSSGMGMRHLDQPITFAGIQSVRTRSKEIGHVDLIIVDEAHLISHKDEGGYRKLIAELTAINPELRVIGLTASPYRLGHGLITDKPAIFDALLEPVTIEQLIHQGHLAPLRSKLTSTRYDLSGVHKRGGEYIESELQAAVDSDAKNQSVVDECIRLAGDRKSWLFFCAGVAHAQHVRDVLIDRGVVAECVTGDTPAKERDRILADFKAGEIRALTNANVLSTGFDAPDIDMIAFLRPTMSPSLYVQMAGRGMRIKSEAKDCLVLDFAGLVSQHGPITAIKSPKKGGGEGDAPVKVCPECQELVHLSVMECPACGHKFERQEKAALKRHDDDIMGVAGTEMAVSAWTWREHISRASGKAMLSVTYYGTSLDDQPVTEYLPILHEGYAGDKAMRMLIEIERRSCARLEHDEAKLLSSIASAMNKGNPPSMIEFKRDGKYNRVILRRWA